MSKEDRGTMEIRRSSMADLDRLSLVMDGAFRHRPLSDFVCPRPRQADGLMIPFYRAVLRVSLAHHDVIQIGDPAHGVAIWEGPDAPPAPGDAWDASGLWEAVAAIGGDAPERCATLFAHLREAQQRLRPARAWYLVGIGVDPEWQGRGFGRGLVRWGLERAAADGVPAYLETNEARNVAFYERDGFRVREHEVFGDRHFPIWHMQTGDDASLV